MIGTAPLNPTQAISSCSRQGNRNGHSNGTTASGRATMIRTPASSNPDPATLTRSLGVLSRPSTTNIAICPIHARPSMNRKVPR